MKKKTTKKKIKKTKVYCSRCKHYKEVEDKEYGECTHDSNLVNMYNWEHKINFPQQYPHVLNNRNDCENYEDKWKIEVEQFRSLTSAIRCGD